MQRQRPRGPVREGESAGKVGGEKSHASVVMTLRATPPMRSERPKTGLVISVLPWTQEHGIKTAEPNRQTPSYEQTRHSVTFLVAESCLGPVHLSII